MKFPRPIIGRPQHPHKQWHKVYDSKDGCYKEIRLLGGIRTTRSTVFQERNTGELLYAVPGHLPLYITSVHEIKDESPDL